MNAALRRLGVLAGLELVHTHDPTQDMMQSLRTLAKLAGIQPTPTVASKKRKRVNLVPGLMTVRQFDTDEITARLNSSLRVSGGHVIRLALETLPSLPEPSDITRDTDKATLYCGVGSRGLESQDISIETLEGALKRNAETWAQLRATLSGNTTYQIETSENGVPVRVFDDPQNKFPRIFMLYTDCYRKLGTLDDGKTLLYPVTTELQGKIRHYDIKHWVEGETDDKFGDIEFPQ